MADVLHQGRDDLYGRRPGADHADALAGKRDVVIPPRAVERGAGERVEPGEVGQGGVMQHTGRGDDEVGLVGRAVLEREPPTTVVEYAAGDLAAVADALVEPVAMRDVLEVGQNFPARREAVAPLGVQRERVAVEVGRDVAGDPRIGVLPPRSPEPVGLLVDDVVVEPGFLELDGRENPGHAGADHDEAEGGVRHPH